MDGWQGGYNRGSFVRVNAMIGMTDTRGQLFKIERIRESRGGVRIHGIFIERISLSLSLPLPSIASTYCFLKDFKNRPYRILDTRRWIVARWRLVCIPPRASTFPLCWPVNILECSPSAVRLYYNSPLLISFFRRTKTKIFRLLRFPQRVRETKFPKEATLQQITLFVIFVIASIWRNNIFCSACNKSIAGW